MSALFVAIRPKTSKRYVGIFQAMPGKNRARIRKDLRSRLPKRFSARILTFQQTLSLVRTQRPRTAPKKRIVKKKVKKRAVRTSKKR